MKLNETTTSNRNRVNKINKVLKEHYGFSFKRIPDVNDLYKVRKHLHETITTIKQKDRANFQNYPQYTKSVLLLDAVNNLIEQSRRRQARKKLNEDAEGMDQAEVIIAARSFLDELQSYIEKVGRAQNENLGPIADRMRENFGNEIADTFYEEANSQFEEVMDSLRNAKHNLSTLITNVANGETPSVGGGDSDMDSDEFNMDDEESLSDEEFGDEEDMDLDDEDFDLDLDSEDSEGEMSFDSEEGELDLSREKKE